MCTACCCRRRTREPKNLRQKSLRLEKADRNQGKRQVQGKVEPRRNLLNQRAEGVKGNDFQTSRRACESQLEVAAGVIRLKAPSRCDPFQCGSLSSLLALASVA